MQITLKLRTDTLPIPGAHLARLMAETAEKILNWDGKAPFRIQIRFDGSVVGELRATKGRDTQ